MSNIIDTTSLTKIGNMSSGGGLLSLFDGSTSTVGYREGSTGWAGVSLSSPQPIEKVLLTSADNGFDASGLSTSITLNLYGKQGSVPASPTDGTLLGTLTFTDQNSTNSKEIVSSDITTNWDHVWVSVSTGVWAILSEIVIYSADEETPPPPPTYVEIGTSQTILNSRICNDKVQLTQSGSLIPQFNTRIKLNEKRVVRVDFHCGIIHNNLYSGPVGISAWLTHKTSSTEAGLNTASLVFTDNDVVTGQIRDVTHHYNHLSGFKLVELDIGYHELGVFMSAHTDGSPYDGQASILAEGASSPFKGRNSFAVSVYPIGVCITNE